MSRRDASIGILLFLLLMTGYIARLVSNICVCVDRLGRYIFVCSYPVSLSVQLPFYS